MLSPNSTYAAYIVFKVAPGAYGLDSPYPETSVSLGGSKSTCHVCLDVSDRDDEDSWLTLRPSSRRSYLEIPPPNVGAFSSQKKFAQYPLHRIFRHMHGALNTVEQNN